MLAVAEIIEAAGVAGRLGLDPADDPRAGRPDGRRPALQAADVHRLAVGRLADEGARRQEAGRARARRQRRRHRRQDRRPRLGGQALPGRRRSPMPARSASASSARSSTRTSGTRSWTSSSQGARALKVGDPLDPTTDVGPMVDATAAGRTQRWVDEAVALGGKVLLGGKADGTFFPPTILTDVPTTAQVCSNEAFAPLVVAFPFRDLDDAIARVNDSMFGLQTGVFTNDLAGAWRAFGELEVGGVIINDVPTYRIDHMPYGGVKDSGLGPRGPALRDRGHDRDPDHGARPARLTRPDPDGAPPPEVRPVPPVTVPPPSARGTKVPPHPCLTSRGGRYPGAPFNDLHRGHRRLSIDSPVLPAWTRGTAWNTSPSVSKGPTSAPLPDVCHSRPRHGQHRHDGLHLRAVHEPAPRTAPTRSRPARSSSASPRPARS